MCWMCDNPGATIADAIANVRGIIRTNGWAIQYVEDDRAPYAYTIGLHAHKLPEWVVTGMTPRDSANVLNRVAGHVMCSGALRPGDLVPFDDWHAMETLEVDHPDAHLNYAIAIEGPAVTARQLAWADHYGKWPWDRSFRHKPFRQFLLGTRATRRPG
jgi:hypothetical protein